MTVTIRDVAEAAGVSPATVSRVMTGAAQVDPALAERVRVAAERLGYRANRAARALRRQATDTVGVVVPDLANPFFPIVVQSVEAALRSQRMSVLLCDSGNDVELEGEALQSLIDHQVDGLLVSAVDRMASRHAVRMAATRVPLVQLDRLSAQELPYVGADQEMGVRQLIAHLTEAGCRRFAYVSSSLHISTSRDRVKAFVRRVRRIDPTIEERVFTGDFSLEWGREAGKKVLACRPRPDVIVCANDLTAVGVLQVLHDCHLSVPDDVMLTGFDDTVLAVASQPSLTTVRQPLQEMGAAAVTLLRALIAGDLAADGHTMLPTTLVVRDSTGPRRRKPARR